MGSGKSIETVIRDITTRLVYYFSELQKKSVEMF